MGDKTNENHHPALDCVRSLVIHFGQPVFCESRRDRRNPPEMANGNARLVLVAGSDPISCMAASLRKRMHIVQSLMTFLTAIRSRGTENCWRTTAIVGWMPQCLILCTLEMMSLVSLASGGRTYGCLVSSGRSDFSKRPPILMRPSASTNGFNFANWDDAWTIFFC